MASSENINIEIAYGTPGESVILTVNVPYGSTIMQGIEHSGILEKYPEIDLTRNKVGIFSKLKPLDETLNEGDRIEIYRPLIADPKDARRSRAERQKI